MDRDEYLRVIRRGYDLAFEEAQPEAGALQYASALATLAPGELAYSDHHGEYATVLEKLGRHEDSLVQRRLALAAAIQEDGQHPDPIVVALNRYFLGQQLVEMGRPAEALEAIALSLNTRTSVGAPLLTVQAEALVALGELEKQRWSQLQRWRKTPRSSALVSRSGYSCCSSNPKGRNEMQLTRPAMVNRRCRPCR